ncbi:MAG: XRE family transcriptional regulator, partial [Chloroflexota bacterium]|nr:XRE family transcriptional regulator [Chloroflexota bacterium]
MPDRSLAEKLDALFLARGDTSLEDVARAIRQTGGPTISASYLWLLRTGQKDNPTLRHVEALARHFGVAPGHFFADGLTDAVTADAEALVALRSPEVRRLAVRAAGLSERARRALAELADALAEVE